MSLILWPRNEISQAIEKNLSTILQRNQQKGALRQSKRNSQTLSEIFLWYCDLEMNLVKRWKKLSTILQRNQQRGALRQSKRNPQTLSEIFLWYCDLEMNLVKRRKKKKPFNHLTAKSAKRCFEIEQKKLNRICICQPLKGRTMERHSRLPRTPDCG